MAVTRSWTMPGTAPVMVSVPRHRASLRLAWMVAASLLVATGLWFVYQAKLQRMSGGPVLNLNVVTSGGVVCAGRARRRGGSGVWGRGGGAAFARRPGAESERGDLGG